MAHKRIGALLGLLLILCVIYLHFGAKVPIFQTIGLENIFLGLCILIAGYMAGGKGKDE